METVEQVELTAIEYVWRWNDEHLLGGRKANPALHMIAVVRLRYDARTVDYMQLWLPEGLAKKDVLRCLKGFIAREVFSDLRRDLIAA